MVAIGAYEAKTHLPRLLDRVKQGETLTITRHGKPVASLVPYQHGDRQRAEAALARIEARRLRSVRCSMEELMATVHEGHRY